MPGVGSFGFDPDGAVRMAAFSHLEKLDSSDGTVSARQLSEGFTFNGETVGLRTRAEGIYKPKQMATLLSITTVVPRGNREAWYEDQAKSHEEIFTAEETVAYSFKKGDVDTGKNRLLKEAVEHGFPIIYFRGIMPAVYKAIFPVFLTDWDEENRRVQLVFGDQNRKSSILPPTHDDRRYGLRTVKQRLHQSIFRKAILDAYGNRCAISGLPVPSLLDAAHIIADSDLNLGQPIVRNGLALSKVHHAAFDANLIGIDPDGAIHVSDRLMSQSDGPLLESIKALRGAQLHPPKRDMDRPDPDRLYRRFQIFKSAA